MSIEANAGIQFTNPNIVASGETILLTTECDAFENARTIAETNPGDEISCAKCPLSVEFSQEARMIYISGACGNITP